MRVFLFLAVFGLLLATTVSAQAAPAGNPADPVLLNGTYPIKAEAMVDFLFDRDFDLSGDNAVIKGQWYFGKVSIKLVEKIDIYGLIGTADLEIDEWTVNDYTLETDPAVAWGSGFKLLLYETEKYGDGILRVSLGGDYRDYAPGVETVKKSGADVSGVIKREFRYREWQGSLGVSYSLPQFTPYLGVKYSDCECKLEIDDHGTIHTTRANSKDIVGIFLGCDYQWKENISLNLEGRFIDETALNAGFKINF